MEFIEQKPNGALVLLSKDELGTINNALNEVCNGIAIEEWEFGTRLGCTLLEAQDLLRKIGSIYSALPDS